MSLLSYLELCELVDAGVINAPMENVNGSSIDLTLDKIIRIERIIKNNLIDLSAKESINTVELKIPKHGFELLPGGFVLASSAETFNLPVDISAEFKLKSTQARNGLAHILAGHCDPGWKNSKLTLEFHNVTRFHTLLLKPGMKCGQVIFHRVKAVPYDKCYEIRGQYNNQQAVQAAKGLR